jgi:hypothetical protein
MKSYNIPKMISSFENVKIVEVSTGFSHTVAVSGKRYFLSLSSVLSK